MATYKRLQAEVERLAAADGPPSQSRQNGSHPAPQEHNEVGGLSESVSASKKKRIREMKKYEAKVGAALAEGRIEDDLGKTLESWVEKVVSRASTKQVMIARVSCLYSSSQCLIAIADTSHYLRHRPFLSCI